MVFDSCQKHSVQNILMKVIKRETILSHNQLLWPLKNEMQLETSEAGDRKKQFTVDSQRLTEKKQGTEVSNKEKGKKEKGKAKKIDV